MHVDAGELERIASGLERSGRRYCELDLEGAVLDCDHALFQGGFRRPAVSAALEGGPMVIYRSYPLWEVTTSDEVVSVLRISIALLWWLIHTGFLPN